MGSSLSASQSPPTPAQTTLLTLPNELLILIAHNLDRPSYIHSLLLTNRRFNALLAPRLQTFANSPVTLSRNETLTALQWASLKGHIPLVRLLLSHGVDVNAHCTHTRNRPSPSCSTALHHAVDQGNEGVVRLLLDAGARCDIGDAFGDTAAHKAVAYAAAAASKRMLSWLPFRTWEEELQMLRLLLEYTVDLGAKNNKGDTPLHIAVSQGTTCARVVVEALLGAGAPVNVGNNYKYTPLHMASMAGVLGVVKVLLEGGADVTADGEWCLTPVKLAEARGFRAVVRVFGERWVRGVIKG